jgi:hypothetical protein
MAMRISLQKGGISFIAVLVGFVVAVGSEAIAKAVGVDIPLVTRDQATVAITAAVAGAISGWLNWLKHKKDKPAIDIPKV